MSARLSETLSVPTCPFERPEAFAQRECIKHLPEHIDHRGHLCCTEAARTSSVERHTEDFKDADLLLFASYALKHMISAWRRHV